MAYSECCGAKTEFTDIDICPECLEHCSFIEDEEYEQEMGPPLCTLCNGSGEGMWDGSTCSSCKGSGVVIKINY